MRNATGLFLLFAAGCSNSPAPDAGATDLARDYTTDLAKAQDLAAPGDLAAPPDLAASPDLAVSPDLATAPDLAAAPISLQTSWAFSEDAQATTDPTATITAQSASSIAVSYSGSGGCGCSAQRATLNLAATYPCAGSTLDFDWATSSAMDFTHSTALRIDFSGGGSFFASAYAGHSNCAPQLSNTFPTPPELQVGHNTIALGALSAGVDGSCNGSFSSLDVHVEGYTCSGVVTATLSNLAIR
jgi:hypothetical protein